MLFDIISCQPVPVLLKALLVKYGVRDLPGPQPPQALVALIMITHLCPTTPIPLYRGALATPIFGTCAIILSEPWP